MHYTTNYSTTVWTIQFYPQEKLLRLKRIAIKSHVLTKISGKEQCPNQNKITLGTLPMELFDPVHSRRKTVHVVKCWLENSLNIHMLNDAGYRIHSPFSNVKINIRLQTLQAAGVLIEPDARILILHNGHSPFVRSQGSTHSGSKTCPHGSSRTRVDPMTNASKQIAHIFWVWLSRYGLREATTPPLITAGAGRLMPTTLSVSLGSS